MPPVKKSETQESKTVQVHDSKTVKKEDSKTSKSTKVEEVKEVAKVVKKTETKPLVESKNTASKKEDKVMINEVVEDDEDDDEDDEDDEDEDEDDEDDVAAEVDGKQTAADIKEKKVKKTWEEISNEWDENCASLKENETEYKSLLEKVRINQKTRAELDRKRNTLYSLMSKSKDDEVKKATKQKPKREGNKNGGFNKENPVPPVLIKYLGLEDGATMKRPRVMSILTAKFKSAGLKSGQTTTLDKDTAKALGKEKGRVIEFTAFQSFLAEFYKEAFPKETNTVKM